MVAQVDAVSPLLWLARSDGHQWSDTKPTDCKAWQGLTHLAYEEPCTGLEVPLQTSVEEAAARGRLLLRLALDQLQHLLCRARTIRKAKVSAV